MTILILGGGVSGLSAAWFAKRAFPHAKITLLEKADRLGGCIATHSQGPFLFEAGARTFPVARCPELLQLIADLGLRDDLVFSDPSASRRYLWVKGRLRSLSSLWPYILRAFAKDLVTPRGAGEESIYQFASRRFGKKGAELFFDPMTKGVFGGDMHQLSLQACFPSFHAFEQKHRSLVLAMMQQDKQPSGLFTLRGGMSRLIEALGKTAMDIHLGCATYAIESDHVVAGGRKWMADRIICALPGDEMARCTGISLPLRYESLSVVNLGYEGTTHLKGYGYLVPSSEGEELLGQIWDSAVFPQQGLTQLTSMVRSANPEACALDAMRRHLGDAREPAALFHQEAQIPQYDLGHVAKIGQFESLVRSRFPKLAVVGNYFESPSVEACVARAKRAVTDISLKIEG